MMMKNENPSKSPSKGGGSSGVRWFWGNVVVLALIAALWIPAQKLVGKGLCAAADRAVADDPELARRRYAAAANLGDADAQFVVGSAYERGRGLAKDAGKAVEWYRKAAGQGHAGAGIALGKCCLLGAGCARDIPEAARLFARFGDPEGPEGGFDAESCYKVGEIYDRGPETMRNLEKAAVWYKRAADQGHAGARHSLGAAYCKIGLAVKGDDAKAVEWYRKAADLDNELGLRLLSVAYFLGRGVEQNKAKSERLFRKSIIETMPRDEGKTYREKLGNLYNGPVSTSGPYSRLIGSYGAMSQDELDAVTRKDIDLSAPERQSPAKHLRSVRQTLKTTAIGCREAAGADSVGSSLSCPLFIRKCRQARLKAVVPLAICCRGLSFGFHEDVRLLRCQMNFEDFFRPEVSRYTPLWEQTGNYRASGLDHEVSTWGDYARTAGTYGGFSTAELRALSSRHFSPADFAPAVMTETGPDGRLTERARRARRVNFQVTYDRLESLDPKTLDPAEAAAEFSAAVQNIMFGLVDDPGDGSVLFGMQDKGATPQASLQMLKDWTCNGAKVYRYPSD